MDINASIALVTGANRGIGKVIVEALSASHVKRIYATARNIDSLKNVVAIDPQLIIPVELDITNREQVEAVAQFAQDVNLLINNAGVLAKCGLFSASSLENARWEMETNYFGTLHMTRAFAPILKNNGGGAIVNLLSLVSLVNVPMFGTYSASKAALMSLTQATRAELASQGTKVMGVFPSAVDTSMLAGVNLDKTPPETIAKALLQALQEDIEDLYPDEMSLNVLTPVQQNLKILEKQFAGFLPQ